jgi:hypothetical protein
MTGAVRRTRASDFKTVSFAKTVATQPMALERMPRRTRFSSATWDAHARSLRADAWPDVKIESTVDDARQAARRS